MKEFEKQIGITHVLTTAFHPESNGSLERSHQVLKDFLRNMCNEDKDNWDEMISFAV
jgi:Integrase core domain.